MCVDRLQRDVVPGVALATSLPDSTAFLTLCAWQTAGHRAPGAVMRPGMPMAETSLVFMVSGGLGHGHPRGAGIV